MCFSCFLRLFFNNFCGKMWNVVSMSLWKKRFVVAISVFSVENCGFWRLFNRPPCHYQPLLPGLSTGGGKPKFCFHSRIFRHIAADLRELSTDFSTKCGKLSPPAPGICHIPGFPQGRMRHFSDRSTTFGNFRFVILSKMGVFLCFLAVIYVIYVKKSAPKSFPHDFSTGCGKPLWKSFGDNFENPLTGKNIFKIRIRCPDFPQTWRSVQ